MTLQMDVLMDVLTDGQTEGGGYHNIPAFCLSVGENKSYSACF